MTQFERVAMYLRSGEEGAYIHNNKNGRTVEVTYMCGGRYLLMENGEVCRLTSNERVAYNFLKA